MPFVRGDIYRLPERRNAIGHEQRGVRYAVVLQTDELPLSTLIVAPTSTGARSASFRPEIDMQGTRTKVMLEQSFAADPQRLGEFAGRLSANELAEVETALRLVLGLD